MPRLLVVDDEPSVQYSFRYVFEEDGVEVLTAGTAAEGLSLYQQHHPDVVVVDLQLPDLSGLELFRRLREQPRPCPVVFITAHGTGDTALEAMRDGAFDYLIKPLDLERLTRVLGRAFSAAGRSPRPEAAIADPEPHLIGRSPAIQEVGKIVGRLAAQDVNVLILGESGTGKELVARALHRHSRHADRPFVAISCAGTDDPGVGDLAASVEAAGGGTLFLDEVADLSASLQGRLLRLLQGPRGGAGATRPPRVLAATSQDVEEVVAAGRVRKDLYYRLKGTTIRLPALRDHLEDVPDLVNNFLGRFNRELGTDVGEVSEEALGLLQRYRWPGNVRELQAVVREALLRASGPRLLPEFLPEQFHGSGPAAVPLAPAEPSPEELRGFVEHLVRSGGADLHGRGVEALERVLLPLVLRITHGNQTQASEMLGISRNTLRQKMKALGFGVERVFTGE